MALPGLDGANVPAQAPGAVVDDHRDGDGNGPSAIHPEEDPCNVLYVGATRGGD